MSETIKAADAVIGKWYWFQDQAWLCVINDGWGGTVRFYRPIGPDYELETDDDIIPLPDGAGYEYELPPAEPDYAELHAKCGLQVGDRVRVTSKTEPNGWAYRWSIFIDNLVGERGTVSASSLTNGCQVTLDRKVGTLVAAWLPCTSLEKIEPEYRPFANAAEFEPHRDRWITRGRLLGCWRPLGYDDIGVFADDRRKIEWAVLFREYQFEDGQPFGVEVTQ